MKFNRLIFIFISLACMVLAACSDDEPQLPANVSSLNMMNSDNGKTTIGGTDVCLNSARNFVSSKYYIVDLGSKGSLDSKLTLSQLNHEVAAIAGHYYQLVDTYSMDAIAGELAYICVAFYYNVYVDSFLYNTDGVIIGASVQFVDCKPSGYKLPEWSSEIQVDMQAVAGKFEERATYTFDKDAKIEPVYWKYRVGDSDYGDYLNVDIKDNKISFSNTTYQARGTAGVVVRVRYGNVYSIVSMVVSSAF